MLNTLVQKNAIQPSYLTENKMAVQFLNNHNSISSKKSLRSKPSTSLGVSDSNNNSSPFFENTTLAKQISGASFQIATPSTSIPTPDEALLELKKQIDTLYSLKNNLNINNLGQSLAKVNSMNNPGAGGKKEIAQIYDSYKTVQGMIINSYIFNFSLKAQKTSENDFVDLYV